MAIRIALGAGRLRLLWQLLAENFALAVLSGIAGLGVGMALIRLMNRLPYTAVNRMEPFRLDGRVLAFGLVLAAMAALLVGIGAALQCSTRNLRPDAVRGRRMGNVLVFSQIALTAVLLSGAGLLVRSSLLLNGMSRGLDPRHLLSAQIWLPPARYASGDQIVRFSRDAVGRVSALPGVQSASAVNFPALSVLSTSVGIQVEGQLAPRRGDEPVTQHWVIGPAYFETTRIPVLSGRTFHEYDSDESDGVVVVSASMAERFWPGQTALGKRIRPLFPSTAHYWLPKSRTRWLTVVGIVGNVRLDGIAQMPLRQMYLSYRHYPTSILHLLARTAGDPMRLARAVRHEIARLDRDQPVFDIKSMEEVLADSTTRASVLTWLLSALEGWRHETVAQAQHWPDAGLVGEGLRLLQALAKPLPTDTLLATDLHAGNVLRSEREPWLVIAPKPFIGDAPYDLVQHLHNCEARLHADPIGMVMRLADLAEVDMERLQLWTFARAAADPRPEWSNLLWMDVARALAP